MKTSSPVWAAWIITGIGLLGIVACALLHVAIPEALVNLTTAAGGAAAGVSYAGGSGLSDVLAQLVAKLEGLPAPLPPLPAPAAGTTSDPAATGVFRLATHAPS